MILKYINAVCNYGTYDKLKCTRHTNKTTWRLTCWYMSRRLGDQRKESSSAQRCGYRCVGPLYSLPLTLLFCNDFQERSVSPPKRQLLDQSGGHNRRLPHGQREKELPNGTFRLFPPDVSMYHSWEWARRPGKPESLLHHLREHASCDWPWGFYRQKTKRLKIPGNGGSCL